MSWARRYLSSQSNMESKNKVIRKTRRRKRMNLLVPTCVKTAMNRGRTVTKEEYMASKRMVII